MSPSQSMLQSPSEARTAMLGIKLVSLANLLRLVPEPDDFRIGKQSVTAALDAFAQVGVGRHAAAHGAQFMAGNLTPKLTTKMLEDVLEAIEQSPLPDHEWAPMAELLGDDLLESLLGASASSVRRYRTGERPTPDRIAQRLHFVSLIVADLAGSYNSFGIRRWFGRSRQALSGQSPSGILAGDWDSSDPGATDVQALAASLLAPMSS